MVTARKRRRFDEATKRKAVAAIGREGTLTQVAARLDVNPSLLVRWRQAIKRSRPRSTHRKRPRLSATPVSAQFDRLIVELTSMRDEVKALEATKASIEEVMRLADF